jgi:glycine oxidase
LGAATPIDRLRAIGSMRFQSFSEELREITGIDNGYVRCGGIEFLTDDDLYAIDIWENEGIQFEKLSRGALRTYEPAVEETPADAYLLPGCAQVRNPRHLTALIAACERTGVRLFPHSAVGPIHPDPRNERLGRCAMPGEVHADRILVAAGAWSDLVLSQPNEIAVGVHPVRGQIVLLKSPIRPFNRVLMFGKRYLVPRLDGRVLIGSTEEPEARFEKANTVVGVADLLSFATLMVPTLYSAEVEKCWSGLRPATRDGLPFIGRMPGWDNIFVATGHFRSGVQLSISTAQAITELFTEKPTCVPLDSFAVHREPGEWGKGAFRS